MQKEGTHSGKGPQKLGVLLYHKKQPGLYVCLPHKATGYAVLLIYMY